MKPAHSGVYERCLDYGDNDFSRYSVEMGLWYCGCMTPHFAASVSTSSWYWPNEFKWRGLASNPKTVKGRG